MYHRVSYSETVLITRLARTNFSFQRISSAKSDDQSHTKLSSAQSTAASMNTHRLDTQTRWPGAEKFLIFFLVVLERIAKIRHE